MAKELTKGLIQSAFTNSINKIREQGKRQQATIEKQLMKELGLPVRLSYLKRITGTDYVLEYTNDSEFGIRVAEAMKDSPAAKAMLNLEHEYQAISVKIDMATSAEEITELISDFIYIADNIVAGKVLPESG